MKFSRDKYEIEGSLIKAIESVEPVKDGLEVALKGLGRFFVMADYTIFSTMADSGQDEFIANYPWEKL